MDGEEYRVLNFQCQVLVEFAYGAKTIIMSERLHQLGLIHYDYGGQVPSSPFRGDVVEALTALFKHLNLAEPCAQERTDGWNDAKSECHSEMHELRVVIDTKNAEIIRHEKGIISLRKDATQCMIAAESLIDTILATDTTHAERRGQLVLLREQLARDRRSIASPQDDIPF